MIVGNYRQAFKAAIARIYHSNGAIVGAGFLVSDRHLLTCAHVVSAALGIAPETVEMPTTTLELDFPLIAPGQKVKAKVAFWQPVNPTQVGEDIAGLELEEALTEGQPVRLLTVEELWNHPFQIFGFPSKRDEGIWASGVIRDRLANGWVQIEDIKAQGQAVQPGFSGSPIWDEVLQGVVGMAVAADKKRDETKTAFMIPTSILTKAWSELGHSAQTTEVRVKTSSNFKDVEYGRLECLLKEGAWEEANEETAHQMLKAMGRDNWWSIELMAKFPSTHLKTIDNLWVNYSQGKFGFSIQKRIYIECGGVPNGRTPAPKVWQEFSERIGWKFGDIELHYNDVTFDLSEPQGHLPIIGGSIWKEFRHWGQRFVVSLLSHPDLSPSRIQCYMGGVDWIDSAQPVQLSNVSEPKLESQTVKDFFISYNRADKQYAEWIAWTLKAVGYSVVIQAWDFRPGGNFVLDMQRAAAESQKTIAVLSESYLKSSFTQPEWAAAFAQDPQSLERKLIPVRVKECKPEGMLRPIVYIDLVGLSEADAKQALMEGLKPSGEPLQKPMFPLTTIPEETIVSKQKVTEPKAFPSALSRVQQIKEKTLQQRLDKLAKNYEDLAKQRDYTSNVVEQNDLELQLEAIALELDKVAAELDSLGV